MRNILALALLGLPFIKSQLTYCNMDSDCLTYGTDYCCLAEYNTDLGATVYDPIMSCGLRTDEGTTKVIGGVTYN